MNENPEGTPNPLNANPGVPPTEAEPIAQHEQPVEPPVTEPAPSEPQVPVEPQPNVTMAPSEPSVVVDKSKKKGGLIAAIVLLVVAIVGGVAAAIIMLNPFGGQKDPVPTALARLAKGEAPKLVAADGNIEFKSESEELPLSYKFDFKSSLNAKTMENYSGVDASLALEGIAKLALRIDEIGTKDGDYYVSMSGFDVDYDASSPSAYGEYFGSMLSSIAGAAEAIDGEWIHFSMDDFKGLTGQTNFDGNAQCLIDASKKLSDYGETFADIYDKNPFIIYKTDNLKIEKKKNNLYLITLDKEKLASFANAMSETKLIKDLVDCAGSDTSNSSFDANELAEVLSKELPEIYVEIDGNYNFTRLYISASTEEITGKIDVSFSYPSNITVEEPESYLSLIEAQNKIVKELYSVEDFDF